MQRYASLAQPEPNKSHCLMMVLLKVTKLFLNPLAFDLVLEGLMHQYTSLQIFQVVEMHILSI